MAGTPILYRTKVFQNSTSKNVHLQLLQSIYHGNHFFNTSSIGQSSIIAKTMEIVWQSEKYSKYYLRIIKSQKISGDDQVHQFVLIAITILIQIFKDRLDRLTRLGSILYFSYISCFQVLNYSCNVTLLLPTIPLKNQACWFRFSDKM